MKPKKKRCSRCLKKFPATTEYFRRSSTKDGLDYYCKDCASALIKAHYVSFTRVDVRLKGEQGVLCPLWAERCGVCIELAKCWRLDPDCPDEEYPEALFEYE
jgi:hypothetical protein